jgi:UDPglucose--hexose-1-phosphate uridylyltransferase
MPEMRKDPVSGNWVIFSPERQKRPQFFSAVREDVLTREDCPFCEGNEDMTPPELYALREGHGENGPGWRLRVVPNKFPALMVEGRVDKRGEGFYDRMNGVGAHEVVIETNEHCARMDKMPVEAIAEAYITFKRRILDLKQDFRFRYIQVFKNHGARAGATISHPHYQVVAMPVVPARLRGKLESAEAHFGAKERCIFCDIIHNEREFHKRVLLENTEYVAFAPYAPRLPFELAIYPRVHGASFERTGDESFYRLASVLKDTIGRLNKTLDAPSYNIVLNNSPFGYGDRYNDSFHWHIEIIPVISGTGGFELGTHSYINPVLPEESIRILSGRIH